MATVVASPSTVSADYVSGAEVWYESTVGATIARRERSFGRHTGGPSMIAQRKCLPFDRQGFSRWYGQYFERGDCKTQMTHPGASRSFVKIMRRERKTKDIVCSVSRGRRNVFTVSGAVVETVHN